MDGCIGLSEQDASYYFTTDVRDPKTAKAAGGAPRIDIAAFSKALSLSLLNEPLTSISIVI